MLTLGVKTFIYSKMTEYTCLICLDESTPENKIYSTKNRTYNESNIIYNANCACNISVHDKCILQWIKNTPCCPICLKNMNQITIFRLIDIYNWFNRRRQIAIFLFSIKTAVFIAWIVLLKRRDLYSTQM
jgi:hypothetical protein